MLYTGNPNAGWKASFNLPADDSKPTAGVFNAILGPMIDDLAFLYARGIQSVTFGVSTTSGVPGDVVGPASNPGTWQDFPTATGLVPYVDVPNCIVNDVLLCFVNGSWWSQSQIDVPEVRLLAKQDFGGSPLAVPIQGAQIKVQATVTDFPVRSQPQAIFGRKVITKAGTCRVILQGKNTDTGGTVKVGVDADGIVVPIIVARIRTY